MKDRYLSKTPNVTSKCNKNCPAFLVIKKKGFSEPVYTGMAFRLSLTFLKKKKWFSCFILCLQSWLSCFLWCQPHQIFRENYRHQKGYLGFFARAQILFLHIWARTQIKVTEERKVYFLCKQIQMTLKNRKVSSLFEKTIERKKEDNMRIDELFLHFCSKRR